MNLADIGRLVHGHRQALGFSRASINQLETGTLIDLGAAKLIALLDLVGLNLNAGTRKGQEHALQSVSQSASVSYKTLLDPAAWWQFWWKVRCQRASRRTLPLCSMRYPCH